MNSTRNGWKHWPTREGGSEVVNGHPNQPYEAALPAYYDAILPIEQLIHGA